MKKKIAMFTNVAADAVFSAEDVDCIYEVPIRFHAEGVDDKIAELLEHLVARARIDGLGARRAPAQEPAGRGRDRSGRQVRRPRRVVQEPQRGARCTAASATTAASNLHHIDSEEIEKRGAAQLLADMDGILVAPGFGSRGIQGKIDAVRYAREQGVPFFGICLGLQMAVIEFARNVVRPARARTRPSSSRRPPYPVVDLMPEQRHVTDKGGDDAARRLSLRRSTPGSKAAAAYGASRDQRAPPPPLRGEQRLPGGARPATAC